MEEQIKIFHLRENENYQLIFIDGEKKGQRTQGVWRGIFFHTQHKEKYLLCQVEPEKNLRTGDPVSYHYENRNVN